MASQSWHTFRRVARSWPVSRADRDRMRGDVLVMKDTLRAQNVASPTPVVGPVTRRANRMKE